MSRKPYLYIESGFQKMQGRKIHVEDNRIVELYWERNEQAIKETPLKYGGLCAHIAQNILSSHEDSEECVNDAFFAVWNAIPDERPNNFQLL